jgi:hypothetical protein
MRIEELMAQIEQIKGPYVDKIWLLSSLSSILAEEVDPTFIQEIKPKTEPGYKDTICAFCNQPLIGSDRSFINGKEYHCTPQGDNEEACDVMMRR